MTLDRTTWRKNGLLTFILLIYAIFIVRICFNLSFETLWYDEAGQFYISKGLNHFSEPYSPEGGVGDVIYNNARYNQDPGGFSLILHFWSMISANVIWLRLLPFLFYLGSIAFTILFAFQITKDKIFSLICGFVIFTLLGGTAPYQLRAYSIELCGIAFGLWSVMKLRREDSLWKYLFYSLISCVFISSRYTALIFGGIYALFILVEIIRRRIDTRRKLTYISVYSLPLLSTVSLIYWTTTRIQNSTLQPLSYIMYLPDHVSVIIILFVSVTLFCWTTYHWQPSKIKELILLYSSINGIFIVLGYLKFLPWCFTLDKGAPFYWLMMITFIITLYGLLSKKAQTSFMARIGYLFIMITAMIFAHKTFTIDGVRGPSWENTYETIKKIDFSEVDKVYVSEHTTQVVRYLYEYGALKGDTGNNYPSKFILLPGGVHCAGTTDYAQQKERNYQLMLNLPGGSYIMSDYLRTDDFVKNKDFKQIAGCYLIKIK